LPASFKVCYRIAKYKKCHTVGKSLVLPSTTNIVETVLDESYAKELWCFPL